MEWAERQVACGRVLTAASQEYPFRWLGLREGAMSPALWKVGAMPTAPFIAIVGSRAPSPEQVRFARRIATEAVHAGFSIVSGGAWGVDRIAVQAAKRAPGGRVVDILPTGISGSDASDGIARLSLFEPEAEFSTARAMVRNQAIYSLAEAAFVIGARFREGGTWHGCVSALRARLTRVFVLESGSKSVTTALAAMGATLVPASTSLAEALGMPCSPMQHGWFVGEPGRAGFDHPARSAIAQVHC
jgi:DNA processing protein